jgi:hypothetical protein
METPNLEPDRTLKELPLIRREIDRVQPDIESIKSGDVAWRDAIRPLLEEKRRRWFRDPPTLLNIITIPFRLILYENPGLRSGSSCMRQEFSRPCDNGRI